MLVLSCDCNSEGSHIHTMIQAAIIFPEKVSYSHPVSFSADLPSPQSISAGDIFRLIEMSLNAAQDTGSSRVRD